MEKTCLNCYNWYALRCDSIYSEYYGSVTMQDCTCDGFTKCNGFDEIEKETKRAESVNHPNHYNQGIEAIDIIESWGLNFSLGNAIKYILRAPHKGNQVEDLKKSIWYIERELERLEKQ